MKLQVQCTLTYEISSPATSILSILALKSKKQNILTETLTLNPTLPAEELISDINAHRFVRFEATEATTLNISYNATVETYYEEIPHLDTISPVTVAQVPADIIPYLFPSRYCESDQLLRFAHHQFGQLESDYLKVTAVTDWIYQNVEYISGSSNSQTSAHATITEQAGVCRDFAHLAIALCRALTIPARYFTCYAYKLNPPDFHACFEAYIGGNWIVFDATRLVPLNGLVKIAHGRDAADVAVATSYGNISLNYLQVSCEATDPDFTPFYYNAGNTRGLSY
jgi:transglutaminase-like putative cysteine protease